MNSWWIHVNFPAISTFICSLNCTEWRLCFTRYLKILLRYENWKSLSKSDKILLNFKCFSLKCPASFTLKQSLVAPCHLSPGVTSKPWRQRWITTCSSWVYPVQNTLTGQGELLAHPENTTSHHSCRVFPPSRQRMEGNKTMTTHSRARYGLFILELCWLLGAIPQAQHTLLTFHAIIYTKKSRGGPFPSTALL